MRMALVGVLVLVWTGSALAEAPRVVKSVPAHEDFAVDPKLAEIRVEFDQEMSQGGWSWTGGGETFPDITARPRWVDGKTCVLPVKLEPGHEYWLGINSNRARNFKSVRGVSAIPCPIHFKTTGTPAATQPASKPAGTPVTPDQNAIAILALRKHLNEDYSYRDRLGLDWGKLVTDAEPELKAAATDEAFAKRVTQLLRLAKDLHIRVGVGEDVNGIYSPDVRANVDFERIRKLVPGLQQMTPGVAVGHWDDGIAYVWIGTWSAEEDVKAAQAALVGAMGVVVDVRGNGGGDELMAREFAGRFLGEAKVYAKDRIREGGHWSEVYDRVVQPVGPRFVGKVVLLQGPANFSSNESFIQMMQVAGATTVGGKTGGSSGRPMSFELGNGVTITLPSWEDLDREGKPLEGVGLMPGVEVGFEEKGEGDAVLERGLEILRRK